MSGVLSELGKAPFFSFWVILSKSRTVKNSLFCSILSDTLVGNWDTCFRLYRRDVSLCHIPMIVIMSVETNVRYIAIAAPEWRECAPISMGPKPNRPLPSIWTTDLNFSRIPVEVIVELLLFL